MQEQRIGIGFIPMLTTYLQNVNEKQLPSKVDQGTFLHIDACTRNETVSRPMPHCLAPCIVVEDRAQTATSSH